MALTPKDLPNDLATLQRMLLGTMAQLLEIDNNGAERSLRGVAVGRRNWTFLGSDNGRRTAAVLTSLIAT
jgi:hypothetical protein